MPVRPPQNLPPESQPWARSIERDLEALQSRNVSTDLTQNNTLKGLATSLRNLGGVVQALEAQQEQLTEQQGVLAAQQTQILQLLDNLLGYTSIDKGGYSGNLAPGSGWITVGSGELILPGGATSALVYTTVNSSLTGVGSGSLFVSGNTRCVIGGQAGRSQILETYSNGGPANATASQTRILDTPGLSINIEAQVRVNGSTQTPTGFFTSDFSAFVIYTR